MQGSDIFNLPAGPPELCFDKNEFVKKTFSVDEFLHKHRNAAGLEAMRDDLGIYLKVLRSAMIELINEDYADFVNLSSNLIGLDQSINGIQTPLGQLKEEIIMVKMTLTDTMTELSECLNMKRSLRNHMKSVQSVTKVQKSIKKLEDLLTNQLNDEDINPTLLERAALEYVQVDFDIQFCKELTKEPYGPSKVADLHRTLLGRIEHYFLTTLRAKKRDQLERCLRIYCTLDECKVAEGIFRSKVVAPYMHPIISESSLQNSPQGLSGIYTQVLDFLAQKMGELLALTTGTAVSTVKGFDFLINSYWVEVEKRLETHMASIFAPGNPDLFYQKYKQTNDFLNALEEAIGTQEGVLRLKGHPQYKNFQTRWNLPVYFQIRFQEIGGALETACTKPINKSILTAATSESATKLISFASAMQCIQRSWSDGVYMSQIFIRFWKLTLQIIARVSQWIDECTSIGAWNETELSIIQFFVCLYMDIEMLIGELPKIFEMATKHAPTSIRNHSAVLDTCLTESGHVLRAKLVAIRQRLVTEILLNSTASIKQVNDIPRLYRKTNREIPSKPCAYVDQMLQPAREFTTKFVLDSGTVNEILSNILSHLNKQYYSAVDDVLTSVQKTEESLRRLKNLRDKSSSSTASNALSNTIERIVMTDDDKIRLQLQVDVNHWSGEIEKFGLQQHQVEKLDELVQLVEESTKLKVNK